MAGETVRVRIGGSEGMGGERKSVGGSEKI